MTVQRPASTVRLRRYVNRHRFAVAVAVIALAGLALRIVFAYAIARTHPLLGDAEEFQFQANMLAKGHGFAQMVAGGTKAGPPSSDHPPVYIVLEAIVSLFGGTDWAWHDLVDILAGTATVVVTALLGRRVGGDRVGLIAGAIAACYPLLIEADGSLRSESVFALLVTWSLLQTLRLRDHPSWQRAAGLGLLIALAALTRSEGLALVLLFPLARVSWRAAGLGVAACALALTPWLARDWIVFHQPVLISNNFGGLVAGANCAQSYSSAELGMWDARCVLAVNRTSPNEAVYASELRDAGLHYAEHHLSRLPAVELARVGRMFDVYRPRQDLGYEVAFDGRTRRIEWWGTIAYYVTGLLAIAGTVLLVRRRGPWPILLMPLLLVLIVALTSYGATRFRTGAEPALIILAALALEPLYRRVRVR